MPDRLCGYNAPTASVLELEIKFHCFGLNASDLCDTVASPGHYFGNRGQGRRCWDFSRRLNGFFVVRLGWRMLSEQIGDRIVGDGLVFFEDARAYAGGNPAVVAVEANPHSEVVLYRLPLFQPCGIVSVEALAHVVGREKVNLDPLGGVLGVDSGNDDQLDVIKRFPFRATFKRWEGDVPIPRRAYGGYPGFAVLSDEAGFRCGCAKVRYGEPVIAKNGRLRPLTVAQPNSERQSGTHA